MIQTNCPRCDSTRLQHEENYGYWECLDCGQYWALDADDPDYEELLSEDEIRARHFETFVEFDRRNECSKCDGGGLIQEDGELLCCPKCGGSGSSS